jgi:hypothetical protein
MCKSAYMNGISVPLENSSLLRYLDLFINSNHEEPPGDTSIDNKEG